MTRRAVIVDIDGTVAASPHREWFEYDQVHADVPIQPVMSLVCSLASTHQIVFLTGRTEDSRTVTSAWLHKHFASDWGWELHMRADGDRTEHAEQKRIALRTLILPRLTPVLVFEDDPAAVQMYRSEGLLVVDTSPYCAD